MPHRLINNISVCAEQSDCIRSILKSPTIPLWLCSIISTLACHASDTQRATHRMYPKQNYVSKLNALKEYRPVIK